jgi:hypothetical protein
MRNVFEPPNAIVRWLGPCYDPLSEWIPRKDFLG